MKDPASEQGNYICLSKSRFIINLDLYNAFQGRSLSTKHRRTRQSSQLQCDRSTSSMLLGSAMQFNQKVIPPHLRHQVFVYDDELLSEVALSMRCAGLTLNVPIWLVIKEARYSGHIIWTD